MERLIAARRSSRANSLAIHVAMPAWPSVVPDMPMAGDGIALTIDVSPDVETPSISVSVTPTHAMSGGGLRVLGTRSRRSAPLSPTSATGGPANRRRASRGRDSHAPSAVTTPDSRSAEVATAELRALRQRLKTEACSRVAADLGSYGVRLDRKARIAQVRRKSSVGVHAIHSLKATVSASRAARGLNTSGERPPSFPGSPAIPFAPRGEATPGSSKHQSLQVSPKHSINPHLGESGSASPHAEMAFIRSLREAREAAADDDQPLFSHLVVTSATFAPPAVRSAAEGSAAADDAKVLGATKSINTASTGSGWSGLPPLGHSQRSSVRNNTTNASFEGSTSGLRSNQQPSHSSYTTTATVTTATSTQPATAASLGLPGFIAVANNDSIFGASGRMSTGRTADFSSEAQDAPWSDPATHTTVYTAPTCAETYRDACEAMNGVAVNRSVLRVFAAYDEMQAEVSRRRNVRDRERRATVSMQPASAQSGTGSGGGDGSGNPLQDVGLSPAWQPICVLAIPADSAQVTVAAENANAVTKCADSQSSSNSGVSLDFSQTYCGPNGSIPIIVALEMATRVQFVSFKGCGLNDVAAAALCDTLAANCPHLRSLDLRDNPRVGLSAGTHLYALVHTKPKLQKVLLEGTKVRPCTVRSISRRCEQNTDRAAAVKAACSKAAASVGAADRVVSASHAAEDSSSSDDDVDSLSSSTATMETPVTPQAADRAVPALFSIF
jgi:hypothetical protein